MYSGLNGFAGALPLSISFQNLTSGNNQTLKIGDKWVIEVHGNGNAPVVVTGSRDGKPVNFGAMGTTNDSGIFKLEGSVLPDQVGAWVENWTVGGVQAGVLVFTILPNAPVAAPSHTVVADQGPASLLPASFQMPDIPLWLLAAGALGAVVLLGGRR